MSSSLEPNQVRSFIERLERFVNETEFLPSGRRFRGAVILALISKTLKVGRAICALIDEGFPEEAFGLSRTLAEIYFTVRYIGTGDYEALAEKYALYFAKDMEGWRAIAEKYYPSMTLPADEDHMRILEVARKYERPHAWSGLRGQTKAMAMEGDPNEFDSQGQPLTAEFDYEVIYKWASHFVHATSPSINSHASARGDIFKIKHDEGAENRFRDIALFNVIAFIFKIFVTSFRILKYDPPTEILMEMQNTMQSSVGVSTGTSIVE